MVNAERLIGEFIELVQVDSESGGERQIADLLTEKLIALGLDVFEDNAGSEVELGKGTGNLIATWPGNGGNGPVFLLSAHMDTVKPGRGVKPQRQNGVIKSSGDTILGSDDKAGIAAILEALRVIKEQNISHGGLQVVFTVGEEIGLVGAKKLDYSRIKAGMGFVLDSGGPAGEIIIQAPQQYTFKAVIKGKAAHAGMAPEQGINAIVVASHAIANMHTGRIDSETTSNIGIISGGVATNIVPEQVTIQGEVRSLKPAKAKAQLEHMLDELKKAVEQFQATLDLQVEKEYDEIDLNPAALPVRIAVQAAKNIGVEAILTKTGGGSDANVFNGKGLACVNLGIGMQRVHTTDEFIMEEDLVNNARLVVEIIKVAQEMKG
ncbi:peptidase T-like protein [Desulfotomaculum nigrificans CO-1-SRB]|uniref:Peptidase T-like protein n=1 Tax=Desulfotomaculum nigrificans (strain DSM 14880 / VKM B-2319 / CO-1-SRB) TaxID=868595 RepID=F6B9M4_DESCC|nr:M20/M25/M40 family metallo-hydrolase [Desulfotomaculum nigrificans]AEF94920.1 peptidase T-like protein [Desulfotomaculum nigrificans CO-1-SRB]